MNSMIPTHANGVSTSGTPSSPLTFVPRFDVAETSEEIVLWGDVPGVTQESLDLRFEKGELVIHGRVAPRQTEKQLCSGEYGIGDFYRTLSISEAIDVDKISAELKNGVLVIRLPKRDSAKPRRISVKAA